MTNMVDLISESVPDQKAANALMERMYATAKPEAVFSKPVTQGEYTVITAAEVIVGLGYGYGGGGGLDDNDGSLPEETSAESGAAGPVEGDNDDVSYSGGGFSGGGGGGGSATARPVAAIEIGPNGVRVQPIMDPTKVLLALFTTIGSMMMMLSRMRRKKRRK